MANQNAFLVSIYGVNNNALQGTQGELMSFPSTAVLVRPISAFGATTIGAVVMNSVIQLLPSGTVVNQPQYLTPKTVTEVNTLQNT